MLRKELRQLLRDPKSKRLIFGAPLLQLFLFGYAANTDVRDTRTFLVDHDHTAESRLLADALTASGHFRIAGRSDRPADLTRALDSGRALIGIEIPAGFARDLRAGRGAQVQIVVDGTNSNTATVAQGYAARMVQEFGLGFAAAAGNTPAGGVELRSRAWYNPDLSSRVYNVPAVVGMILVLMALLLTALAVVREREIGTLDQLVVTPITPVELILGKTIPAVLIALTDLVLVSTVAILWFDIPLRGSALALLLASLIYILAGVAVGLLISTISRTQQEAFMGMFLFFVPTIVLSGLMYPVHTMPEFFQVITLGNPMRHFLEIVRGIFLKGAGVRDLWVQYLAITAVTAFALYAAVWRFRRTIA
jgi:ABC-2 type transport system permease protein